MSLFISYELVFAISLLILLLLLLLIRHVVAAVLGIPAIGTFVACRASEAENVHGWALVAYTHHRSGLYALVVADLNARLWMGLYRQVAHYQETDIEWLEQEW